MVGNPGLKHLRTMRAAEAGGAAAAAAPACRLTFGSSGCEALLPGELLHRTTTNTTTKGPPLHEPPHNTSSRCTRCQLHCCDCRIVGSSTLDSGYNVEID